jgi:hypothetical protein
MGNASHPIACQVCGAVVEIPLKSYIAGTYIVVSVPDDSSLVQDFGSWAEVVEALGLLQGRYAFNFKNNGVAIRMSFVVMRDKSKPCPKIATTGQEGGV